jgi:hypothetical protein
MKLVKDLRGFLHLKVKQAKVTTTLALSMIMTMCMCSIAFATPATTDFTAVQTALTSDFTIAEIAALIASVIGATVGFALLWFGARKLVSAIITAFKTGKIRF